MQVFLLGTQEFTIYDIINTYFYLIYATSSPGGSNYLLNRTWHVSLAWIQPNISYRKQHWPTRSDETWKCGHVWHVHVSGMCVRRGLGPGQHGDLPHMTGSHFPGLPGFPRPAQVCRDFVKIETSRFWKSKNLPLEDKIHNFWSRRHLDIIPTTRYQLCSIDSGENTKSTCFEWNYSGRGKKPRVHVPAFSEAATVAWK